MKSIFFVFACFFTFNCASQSRIGKVPNDNKLRTGLDSLVNQSAILFMENNARVGLSIGVIKNGKRYIYNYGSTQKEQSTLPTGNTICELNSITKVDSTGCASTLFSRSSDSRIVGIT